MAIEFTNKPTKWENDGAEPSTELKKNGFQAGYKPPAGIFNHHWSESAKCIEELQSKLSDVDDKKVDKVDGKSLIDENVADNLTMDSNGTLSLGSNKSFYATGIGDIVLYQTGDGGSEPTLHKLSEKANEASVTNRFDALPIKSLKGQTVKPTSDTSVTADEGATIIGDLRNRVFNSSGIYSGNVASGKYAIALGACNNATAHASIAGGSGNKATGQYAIALGQGNTASNSWTVAIGSNTTASGSFSIAMGAIAKAIGNQSVAIGSNTIASGSWSIAMGINNTALDNQLKVGKYAKNGTAGTLEGTTGDAFIIGNGTAVGTSSNAFRVTYAGKAYGLSAYGSSGADYAEYFEWKDGNSNNEDRRGRLVTLDGEKIRFATADDEYILGVVSANPCVEGDIYPDDWQGKYLTDVFGQRLTQTIHIPAKYEEREVTDPETGETTTESILIEDEHDAVQWVLNPDYDPEQEYVSREDRKEWSPVGIMGKLVVVDDGTCEINGYCKAGVNGIATKSDNGYRVMSRIDDTHIRVLVK